MCNSKMSEAKHLRYEGRKKSEPLSLLLWCLFTSGCSEAHEIIFKREEGKWAEGWVEIREDQHCVIKSETLDCSKWKPKHWMLKKGSHMTLCHNFELKLCMGVVGVNEVKSSNLTLDCVLFVTPCTLIDSPSPLVPASQILASVFPNQLSITDNCYCKNGTEDLLKCCVVCYLVIDCIIQREKLFNSVGLSSSFLAITASLHS